MPSNCMGCPYEMYVNCIVYKAFSARDYSDCRHPECPLVEMPSADVVEVRHGHWLLDSSGAEFCSECGEYPFDDGEYHISGWSSKYCPNCGAKMDKGVARRKEQENETDRP